MIMDTLVIISITLLFCYTLTLCVVNRGIPSSLSATVYALPPAGAWLWTLVIGAASVMTMPVLLERAPENYKFLGYLTIVGLLFVALCPLNKKKDDMTYRAHVAGAIICGVSSQLLVAITCAWLLLAWVPWIVAFVWITACRKWKTSVLWAEMTCFADTFALILTYTVLW